MKQSNNRGHFRGRSNGIVRRNPSGNSSFNGSSTNSILDSNGPCGKIRGNSFQIMEKYLASSKDALSSDDRVLAERCLQHAEHYFRMHLQFAESEGLKRQAMLAENQENPDDIGNRIDEDAPFSAERPKSQVSDTVKPSASVANPDAVSISSVSFTEERHPPIIKKVKMPVISEATPVDDLSDIKEDDEDIEEIKPLDMDLSFPDLSKLEKASEVKEDRPKRRYTPKAKKETSVA